MYFIFVVYLLHCMPYNIIQIQVIDQVLYNHISNLQLHRLEYIVSYFGNFRYQYVQLHVVGDTILETYLLSCARRSKYANNFGTFWSSSQVMGFVSIKYVSITGLYFVDCTRAFFGHGLNELRLRNTVFGKTQYIWDTISAAVRR